MEDVFGPELGSAEATVFPVRGGVVPGGGLQPPVQYTVQYSAVQYSTVQYLVSLAPGSGPSPLLISLSTN